MNTGSAAGTFGIIYHRDTVGHFDAGFRTVFNAELALDAPVPAVFRHHRFIHIQVGAKGTGTFLISGNDPDDMLGTFVGTCPAAGTFGGVYVGNAVFAHAKGAEFADPDAVAETLAAPVAALYASG